MHTITIPARRRVAAFSTAVLHIPSGRQITSMRFIAAWPNYSATQQFSSKPNDNCIDIPPMCRGKHVLHC